MQFYSSTNVRLESQNESSNKECFIIGMVVKQDFMHEFLEFMSIVIYTTTLPMSKKYVHDFTILVSIEFAKHSYTQRGPTIDAMQRLIPLEP
jgi:hypothetical protein